MLILGLAAAGVAAAFHVFVFVLESLRWSDARTRRIFGIRSDAEAQATRPLVFNQGFYNLFLALLVVVGIMFVAAGSRTVGLTLVIAGCAVMLGAGIVLLVSNSRMLQAALLQGGPPLVALAALAVVVLAP